MSRKVVHVAAVVELLLCICVSLTSVGLAVLYQCPKKKCFFCFIYSVVVVDLCYRVTPSGPSSVYISNLSWYFWLYSLLIHLVVYIRYYTIFVKLETRVFFFGANL